MANKQDNVSVKDEMVTSKLTDSNMMPNYIERHRKKCEIRLIDLVPYSLVLYAVEVAVHDALWELKEDLREGKQFEDVEEDVSVDIFFYCKGILDSFQEDMDSLFRDDEDELD